VLSNTHPNPRGQIIDSMALGQGDFFWKKQRDKALLKQLYRSIHLARCNPDYKLRYPNECRENPEHHILSQCHPEAKKRICHQYETFCHRIDMPTVDRPMRLNKGG